MKRSIGIGLLIAPCLTMLPGKLGGRPHITNTRVEPIYLYTLWKQGYGEEAIGAMYPDLTAQEVRIAVAFQAGVESTKVGA
jgi:uncharacterized protein (DUF433 family)